MSRINWTQVLVFGAVVLVVFVLGITFLSVVFGGWGMMGGGGMMGGWCPWCGGTGRLGGGGLMGGLFGLIFGLLALLIPIGLLGLLIVGGVWLVRNVGRATAGATKVVVTPAPAKTCPGCGQPVQAERFVQADDHLLTRFVLLIRFIQFKIVFVYDDVARPPPAGGQVTSTGRYVVLGNQLPVLQ